MTDRFYHIFKEGSIGDTICLFHGTGGDETDLLPLARHLNPKANVLSLRGNINEGGMNRFFKRISPAVFDEEDIIFQSGEIVAFLKKAERKYGFKLKQTVFVGFSNGANIAASILLLHPSTVKSAILLRPMLPLMPEGIHDLRNHSILVSVGKKDTMIPVEKTKKLISLFKKFNADIEEIWHEAGHSLTEKDLHAAKLWYDKKSA